MLNFFTVVIVLYFAALFYSPAHAATNYEISSSNCIAWSESVLDANYAYSFSPTIAYGGSLQVSFMAHHLRGLSQDHIDTVIESKVNGKIVGFAVQGHGATIIFRPQEKEDTRYLLDTATTGSLTFNGMVFKTGGTKRVVNYMLSHCKS